MEKLVGEHPNIIVFQDDILIGAEQSSELTKLRDEVLRKLTQAGVVLNESKLIMESREVRFLGHTLNGNGIHPDQAMVDKIRAIKLPNSKKELAKFLGLVQFYGRLIPNFAEMCRPLHELRVQSNMGVFDVTASAIESFDKIKAALSSKPCVKPYDLNSPVC